jgi:MFS family permease
LQWLSWDLNLKTRLLGETLFNLLFWMYFPFMTLFFSETFGKQTAGLLMSVPPLMGLFGSLLGGFLADHWGRRPVMLLGALLQTCMFILFALSPAMWLDYAAYIGIGLGGSIYGPASSAMVADLTPEKDRRRVYAAFVTANNIGAVLGPALGAFLFFSYRSELLWTCSIVTFLYTIAILFIIRETVPLAPSISNPAHSDKLFKMMQKQWANYILIFRDKIFAIYVIAGILITLAFMQLDLYLAVYVKDYVPAQKLLQWGNRSLTLSSVEVFGWMIGLNGLLFVLCSVPVAKWFEHWSDRDTLIFSAVLFGAGMFCIGLTVNVWPLLAFTAIFSLGELIRSPVAQSFVSKYARAETRGQYMGASGLQISIGRLLAPGTVVLSAWMTPQSVFGVIFSVREK